MDMGEIQHYNLKDQKSLTQTIKDFFHLNETSVIIRYQKLKNLG